LAEDERIAITNNI